MFWSLLWHPFSRISPHFYLGTCWGPLPGAGLSPPRWRPIVVVFCCCLLFGQIVFFLNIFSISILNVCQCWRCNQLYIMERLKVSYKKSHHEKIWDLSNKVIKKQQKWITAINNRHWETDSLLFVCRTICIGDALQQFINCWFIERPTQTDFSHCN